jgi:hypothetical protein
MRGLPVGQHRFDALAEIGQGAVLRDRRGSLDRRHASREGSAADQADSRESDEKTGGSDHAAMARTMRALVIHPTCCLY